MKYNLEPNVKFRSNQNLYRTSIDQKASIESHIKDLSEKGFIRDSISKYSSPIVIIKKKDGSERFCIDYRQINRATLKTGFYSHALMKRLITSEKVKFSVLLT
jgi:hypothetical protein